MVWQALTIMNVLLNCDQPFDYKLLAQAVVFDSASNKLT